MPRYKITLEYDGAPFVGWQRQDTGPSIQASIEDAVFGFSGERVKVIGAGRTDTGVHATGQVGHFDLASDRTTDVVRDALNYHLKPNPIVVLEAEAVDRTFHARFSATGRRYLYRILNRRAPPALDRGRVWSVFVRLDVEAMADAAAVLEGHHDFNSFRSTACQSPTSMKTLDRLAVQRLGDEIRIEAASRSFLHNQVRILVGTLKMVGEGKWTKRDVEEALAARDRTRAGQTAPPEGLCLTEVRYDSEGHHRYLEDPVDDQ
jgi:tRNA pseudouridine38-40 synthase